MKSSKGSIDNVKIEYSVNNGTDWNLIVGSTENDGSYDWEVPCDISADSLIRISDLDSNATPQHLQSKQLNKLLDLITIWIIYGYNIKTYPIVTF